MSPAERAVALEFAVEGPAGARVAAAAGADRIELCAALSVHGVTPSIGAIEEAVAVGIPVHVLIRPRPGDFVFDGAEIAVMSRDAGAAVAAGAAGVVIGGVRGARVDDELVRALRDAAGDATLTFHRAFDALPEPLAALDELIELGVRRVLTSGGADAAGEALAELAALVEHAAGRIEIMAGGGVSAASAAALVSTGVDALHASARAASSADAYAAIDPGAARALAAALGR